ncbi:HSP20-like chaperone [Phascolomyces articulosus]|uniref:HSP20-like chaperone n=1 Tax=Phascolomyces articulosus TaxID=60185 RepID=A0AAD5KLF9_9FUNG|nr:HSP20-like chaperone [Phascolomyces articulosus]
MSFSNSNSWASPSGAHNMKQSVSHLQVGIHLFGQHCHAIHGLPLVYISSIPFTGGNHNAFLCHQLNMVNNRHAAPSSATSSSLWMVPATNIYENEKGWVVRFEIPGVKKEDIKMDVVNNWMTISGEAKFDKKYTDNTDVNSIRYEERYQGTFIRSLTFPDNVDLDKISAKLDKIGILHVDLPKAEGTTSSRVIAVK